MNAPRMYLVMLAVALTGQFPARANASTSTSVTITQAPARGVTGGGTCTGGGSATGGAASLSLVGSCADDLGNSTSSVAASPGRVGANGTAFSFPSSTSLGETGGGSATYDGEVVFTSTDPQATTTFARANLDFQGTVNSAGDSSAAQVRAGIVLDGVENGLLINESNGLPSTCAETGQSGTGFCAGLVAADGTLKKALTTVQFVLPLNVPIPVRLFVTVSAGSALGGSATASFAQSLGFTTNGSTFTLDPGVTVNSTDGAIVNNAFIDTSTWPSVPPLAVYDPVQKQVLLPVLLIGPATYYDVVVGASTSGVVAGPSGTSPASIADRYDPVTRRLTIPTVKVGDKTFFNVVVIPDALASIRDVTGADTYDGNHLTIPLVQVDGGSGYHDVVVTVDRIMNVAGGLPQAARDLFTPSTRQLLIPAVKFAGKVYTNVTITVRSVLSVGGTI